LGETQGGAMCITTGETRGKVTAQQANPHKQNPPNAVGGDCDLLKRIKE